MKGIRVWIDINEAAKILGHTRVAASNILIDFGVDVQFINGQCWFDRNEVVRVKVDMEETFKCKIKSGEFKEAMNCEWDEGFIAGTKGIGV